MEDHKQPRGRRFRQRANGNAEFNDGVDRGDGRTAFGTFPKGQSGNPHGRPDGALNAATIIRQVLSEKVTMTTPEGSKTVSKLAGAVAKLVNLGLTQNSVRALERTIMLALSVDEKAIPAKPPLPIDAADQAVLTLLAKRLTNLADAARAANPEASDGDVQP